MTRPLVGVSTYREQARWRAWDLPAVLLPAAYVDAVATAGGEPVLLPTGAATGAAVGMLDALVLAGGPDVEPARYGAEVHAQVRIVQPQRDATELDLLGAALDTGTPLLAVCRGMQLLNVALGGDLVQHLPDVPGTGLHDAGPGTYVDRDVTTAEGSGLRSVLGPSAPIRCHHHQALGRLGTGLTATAWAEDGTVEAVERAGPGWCVGVQWHPEAGPDGRLFAALLAAAAERAGRR